MAVTAPVFSDLCNSSVALYRQYIVAYNRYLHSNGQRIDSGGDVGGNAELGPCCGRCFDIGGSVGRAITDRVVGRSGKIGDVDVDSTGVVSGVDDSVGDSVGDSGQSSEDRVAGVSHCDFASHSGGVVGAVRDTDGEVSSVGVGQPVLGSVGVPPGVGANWARNQEWKKKRKAARVNRARRLDGNWRDGVLDEGRFVGRSGANRGSVSVAAETDSGVSVSGEKATAGFFSCLSKDVQMQVKESRARLFIAENNRRLFKAERELEAEKAVDMAQVIQRERTKVLLATERNMVNVEKAHASLVRSGNVAGVVDLGGTAVTQVSGFGDGSSISPGSSASMAEYRRMAKELEDVKKENIDLIEKYGVHPADPLGKIAAKSTWTLDDKGDPIMTQEQMDQLFPFGYSVNTAYTAPGRGAVLPLFDV